MNRSVTPVREREKGGGCDGKGSGELNSLDSDDQYSVMWRKK